MLWKLLSIQYLNIGISKPILPLYSSFRPISSSPLLDMVKKRSKNRAEGVALSLLKSSVFLYDVSTLPAYFLIQKPWRYWKIRNEINAGKVDAKDATSPYVRYKLTPTNSYSSLKTVDEYFRQAVKDNTEKKCFGYRPILEEFSETQADGKVFKKVVHGDYVWLTYNEADSMISKLTRSLLMVGIKPRKRVLIFSETRMEWMMTALACLRINIPIVTLFSTLGEEGIVHGINESEAEFLFTSTDLLPKLKKLVPKMPYLSTIVYFQTSKQPDLTGFPPSLRIISYEELFALGKDLPADIQGETPTADDEAVVMYTSGSSGTPKGVIFQHKHIMQNIESVANECVPFQPDRTYIAYLPLSHIFEMAVELLMFRYGLKIGYSSPFTLTDKSTGVVKGQLGDLKVLRPEYITAVPLVLDKIRKSILEAIEEKGTFTQNLFKYALNYKSFWYKNGFQTPILDRIMFKKIREVVGGKLEIIATGGAPLSTETLDFVRLCLNVCVVQAYGQTESAGIGTFTHPKDRTTGHVGSPMKDTLIKLIDWKEGGYSASDLPHPRGEVVIGGPCVAMGYLKNEQLTEETFYEEKGVRWVKTGDIGEALPNGTFKLIDRKKDLIKLQFGEFISLGKVEAELKTSPLIDNVCVIGNSYQNYLVALIVPNKDQLLKIAKMCNLEHLNFEELCRNDTVTEEFSDMIKSYGAQCHLHRTEIPNKIKLCSEEWLPDTGLVTAGLKIRRKPVQIFYEDSINDMYGMSKQRMTTQST